MNNNITRICLLTILYSCLSTTIAGEGDLESRLIMLQRAKDDGPNFAVRKNNKTTVKIKNNGPDNISGIIELQVFRERVKPQGNAIYRKVHKLKNIKADELRDIEFDGIEISEEGHYVIQAMISTIGDDVDPKKYNNQVIRRPSKARKLKSTNQEHKSRTQRQIIFHQNKQTE